MGAHDTDTMRTVDTGTDAHVQAGAAFSSPRVHTQLPPAATAPACNSSSSSDAPSQGRVPGDDAQASGWHSPGPAVVRDPVTGLLIARSRSGRVTICGRDGRPALQPRASAGCHVAVEAAIRELLSTGETGHTMESIAEHLADLGLTRRDIGRKSGAAIDRDDVQDIVRHLRIMHPDLHVCTSSKRGVWLAQSIAERRADAARLRGRLMTQLETIVAIEDACDALEAGDTDWIATRIDPETGLLRPLDRARRERGIARIEENVRQRIKAPGPEARS